MGRETKSGSQQVSKLALAAHTKLKFRQPGQTSRNDLAVRDLRAELLAAERAAVDKKRKAAGLPPLPVNSSSLRLENGDRSFSGENNGEDDKEGENEVIKRRRILEEVGDLDKDDEEDEVDGGVGGTSGKLDGDKGKGKAATVDEGEDDDEDESDEWVVFSSPPDHMGKPENADWLLPSHTYSDSDSDDDDDTAALMAELAKIKQERAEEKARLVSPLMITLTISSPFFSSSKSKRQLTSKTDQ